MTRSNIGGAEYINSMITRGEHVENHSFVGLYLPRQYSTLLGEESQMWTGTRLMLPHYYLINELQCKIPPKDQARGN